MSSISLNNLLKYLETALSVEDQKWLANKLIEVSNNEEVINKEKEEKNYRISPRRKKFMETLKIDPKDFAQL